MGVILITEISISDISILRSINVEVFLLVILDSKQFTLGLIVVFVTGMAMIILYVRRRRKKNDGFVPLNTKDDDEL